MALSDSALTTLVKVKLDLGITDTSEDAKLEVLIDDASDMITDYLNRTLKKQEVTEAREGYGSDKMRLDLSPIDASEDITITYDGGAVDSSNYEIHNATAGILRHKYTAWNLTSAYAGGLSGSIYHGSERKLYSVTYTGGYILPNDTTDTPDLPGSIERSCRMTVAWLYAQTGRDLSIKSEKLMSWSATYQTGESGLPTTVEQILGSYRRWDS